ncbi:Flagellar biosynthesis protein flhA [Serratia fonticola]|uniref:Flagellar biosynthesis protein flhA n=1 Tax=Serratia fonticola TaxID=47917 RepID=A0A4U9WKN9_SERFO|nr:Flagellar biosynthesis protein flhA [Serratia fonticola]
MISTAAGVIVTRVATDEDVGEQMVNQLFNNPRVMVLSAAVLGFVGDGFRGCQTWCSCCFTAALLALAWRAARARTAGSESQRTAAAAGNPQAVEASWSDVQLEDPLGMEVGYRLIPWWTFSKTVSYWGVFVASVKNSLRIRGYLPPVVHIRDNLELSAASYRILMKGVEIGSGEAHPGRWLAINPGNAVG